MAHTNPFLLAADNSPNLLPLLRSKPEVASSQDEHGYSLMHAAVSYNHLELLRTLVKDFKVDPNLKDEDGETALFVVETVEAAQILLEELGADASVRNSDGQTAEEKIRTDGDYPTIADYLRETRTRNLGVGGAEAAVLNDRHNLPPLPPNVTINVASTDAPEFEESSQAEPDPDFRRRIEELASRQDFQGEDGQRDLRDLIRDAVRGVGTDGERDVRRRIG